MIAIDVGHNVLLVHVYMSTYCSPGSHVTSLVTLIAHILADLITSRAKSLHLPKAPTAWWTLIHICHSWYLTTLKAQQAKMQSPPKDMLNG